MPICVFEYLCESIYTFVCIRAFMVDGFFFVFVVAVIFFSFHSFYIDERHATA